MNIRHKKHIDLGNNGLKAKKINLMKRKFEDIASSIKESQNECDSDRSHLSDASNFSQTKGLKWSKLAQLDKTNSNHLKNRKNREPDSKMK